MKEETLKKLTDKMLNREKNKHYSIYLKCLAEQKWRTYQEQK